MTAALGAPQAEDASTVLWGARDGTCLRLTCEHGAVRELELRVDLRERDSRLLRAVLDAAACLDLVIITETNHLIPSTRTAVLAAARCTSPGDAGM